MMRKHDPDLWRIKMKMNDVYVKIYETAQLTLFYVFYIKKQMSTLTLQMYCGLHFQLCRAHYHS
jgi:hypothetical protein